MDLPLVEGLESRGLPQELIDTILSFLRDDQKALKQCCLASRFFQPSCQKLIFECIRLHSVGYEDPDGGGSDQGVKVTMAQRLQDILVSSPHLASFIKELRIMNTIDESGEPGNRLGWLEHDTSLPVILPLLVNLERFYLSGVSTHGSKIDIKSLPRAVQDALFLTWKSPNLKRIGVHRVRFASFGDLFSVLLHSPSVRDITFCYVIFPKDERGHQGTTNANAPGGVSGQPVSSRAEQTRIMNSLSFYGDGPEISSRFYAALLSNTKLIESLSSLRKLYFPVGTAVQNDLYFLRQFLRICPALEELHTSMYTWLPWRTTFDKAPVDISSCRVIHLAVDLFNRDIQASRHPVLRWWCEVLSSFPSLSLREFEIYAMVSFGKTIHTLDVLDRWEFLPEWERLDGILGSKERPVNLKIRILFAEEGNPDLFKKEMKQLECNFSRMRDKGRLEIGCVHADEIYKHYGVNWT